MTKICTKIKQTEGPALSQEKLKTSGMLKKLNFGEILTEKTLAYQWSDLLKTKMMTKICTKIKQRKK